MADEAEKARRDEERGRKLLTAVERIVADNVSLKA